jgi:hypothetical protein
MAKKKTSREPDYLAGYIPATFNPGVTAQEILQIPPYDDVGVSFKNYSKDLRGSSYILKRQLTRFYSYALSNSAAGNATIARSNKATHTFYCSGILFQASVNPLSLSTYIDIRDGSATEPRARIFTWTAAGVANYIWLDLSSCPRKFVNDIVIHFNAALALTDFVHIELFGWDEEN